jgi:hypothetical protein
MEIRSQRLVKEGLDQVLDPVHKYWTGGEEVLF